MSRAAELFGSRRAPHLAALALIAFGVAGCSGDMSTRFSQSSFGNPFNVQPESTGSVPAQPAQQPAPRELPQYARPQSQYQSSALPPPVVSAPQSSPVRGVSGGGRGLASYSPPAQPRLETTGTVPPRSIAATHPQGGSATTIIVGTSDTLEILAQRYHVTPAAILAANGYKGPRTLSPGQSLIIPRATAAVAAPVPAAPATKPVATAAPSVHVVNHGDTLAGIARRNHVSVAELARANKLKPSAKLKLGTRLTVPGARIAETAQPAPQAPAAQSIATTPVPATRVALAAAPQQIVRLAQANPAPDPVEINPPAVKSSEATGALPTFRWPVRGKVITGYGAKTNGKANDGINLAVPEGTPIKAAEDGIVAYSGNELKGYGNLVLVRHSNGYVTAYAHASELLVKRGDTIKRGQVIAKSGQSGEVGSPQLHFEIRKGSQPVDPLQFLNGA
jgi:murein DD-endopeptidase MepM/ murein hydrolase activator NlpD